MTKLVQDGLILASFSYSVFYGRRLRFSPSLGQYPAIFTLRLVNVLFQHLQFLIVGDKLTALQFAPN